MRWEECCEKVGLGKYEPPVAVKKYFAYKEGKVVECNNKQDAESISKNYEMVVVNKNEIEEYSNKFVALERAASELFHSELRKEYSNLPDCIYNLCYIKAYEDGHHAGHNEVAAYLKEHVEFAEAIISANN